MGHLSMQYYLILGGNESPVAHKPLNTVQGFRDIRIIYHSVGHRAYPVFTELGEFDPHLCHMVYKFPGSDI